MHQCQICGDNNLRSWEEYHIHHEKRHNVTTRRVTGDKVRPASFSGRTAKQIVEDAERTWLEPHLISVRPAVLNAPHGDGCRCAACWERYQREWVLGQILHGEN